MTLHQIYTDPSHPAGFSSIERLFQHAKKENPGLTRKNVVDFLSSMDSYTLYRRNSRRFDRLKFRVKGPRRILSMDIADMIRLEDFNDNFRYLLVCVDTFSRFARVVPLKTKTGTEVAKALEDHVLKHDQYPRIHVDKGKEFYNTVVQNMLKKHESELYSTFGSNTHAIHSERFIRTLKGRLFRWMKHNNTWRWIDTIQEICSAYNHATHRTFKNKYTPHDVHYNPELTPIIREMIYGKRDIKHVSRKLLKPQTTVRLAQLKSVFGKEHYPMNSEEIFRIKSAELKEGIPIYRLEDLKNKPVRGLFYHNDLVPTAEKDLYVIDKILKTRGRGRRKQYFISYLGYPAAFNEWITQNQLTKL
jgi:hypothetical protein